MRRDRVEDRPGLPQGHRVADGSMPGRTQHIEQVAVEVGAAAKQLVVLGDVMAVAEQRPAKIAPVHAASLGREATQDPMSRTDRSGTCSGWAMPKRRHSSNASAPSCAAASLSLIHIS